MIAMKWQESDALIDLNDAIEDVFDAAILLQASGRTALALELHDVAKRMIVVRTELRRLQ